MIDDKYTYGGFEILHYGQRTEPYYGYKAIVRKTLKLRGRKQRSTTMAIFEHTDDPNVPLVNAQRWIDEFNAKKAETN